MRRKRTCHIAWTTGVVLAVALLASCAEGPEEEIDIRPVKTMELGASAQGGARVFPGTVRAVERAKLSFRVAGPLVQLPITEGMDMKKGDLLAQIDPRDFQRSVDRLTARLAELEAEYRAMQIARPEDLERAEANLSAARARLGEADATFRRFQRLYENDNVARAEFDQRRAARDVARAEVRSAEETLNIAKRGARVEDIEAMEARIRETKVALQEANDRLGDTSLRAPYEGAVAEKYVENFEYVKAQQPILSLQDVSVVEIRAEIPEVIMTWGHERRRRNLEFVARFEGARGKEFTAEVTELATQADPVTRTFTATFQLPQPEGILVLAGMTAEIAARDKDPTAEVYAVPIAAVTGDETGAEFVWLVDRQSMTARKTKVEVGELVGDRAIILEGLQTGDTVITAGASFIVEGQEVREITDELRERK